MINKDTTIEEVLNGYSNGQLMLQGFGMHCFGCPMSRMETLGEASQAHGIDLNLMLAKLNEYLVSDDTQIAPKKVRAGCKTKNTVKSSKQTGKKA